MNYSMLTAVIPELARLLVNARVERVYETASGDIVMVLRNRGKTYFLLASPDRSMPRLHLLAKKPPAALSLHPFALYLKSRAIGASISGIALLNQDRIVEVRFRGQNSEMRFIFELTGHRSNLFITDPAGRIESLYHPVPTSESTSRPLQTGMHYAPPTTKRSAESHGCGPAAAGSVLQPQSGQAPANRDAEAYYERMAEQKRFSSLRRQLYAIIEKNLKKTERRRDAIETDQKESDSAELLRKSGELILANMNRISSGMKEIELEDYDGRPFLILLDPRRSTSGNADQYFKKYKKLRSGREIRVTRLREASAEARFLRGLLEILDRASNDTELGDIRSVLAEKGYLIPGPEKVRRPGQTARTGPDTASYRRIQYRGWDLIVGKSAAGNDHITFALAGPNDLWLHAEGLPGSHVLVRNQENRVIGQDILLKAAALAAYYSKGRSAGKVPVTYTFARHVKKPRGAKPGLVTLMQRRTIMAVPERE